MRNELNDADIFKKEKIGEVNLVWRIYNEDMPVKGNAMLSGDEDFDREVENKIQKRLNLGQLWAWCTVGVFATYKDLPLEGSDFLGGCSYSNTLDFMSGGCAPDMKHNAIYELLNGSREYLSEKVITDLEFALAECKREMQEGYDKQMAERKEEMANE